MVTVHSQLLADLVPLALVGGSHIAVRETLSQQSPRRIDHEAQWPERCARRQREPSGLAAIDVRERHRARCEPGGGEERSTAIEAGVALDERPERHRKFTTLLEGKAKLLRHRVRTRRPVSRILGQTAVDQRGDAAGHGNA